MLSLKDQISKAKETENILKKAAAAANAEKTAKSDVILCFFHIFKKHFLSNHKNFVYL